MTDLFEDLVRDGPQSQSSVLSPGHQLELTIVCSTSMVSCCFNAKSHDSVFRGEC